MIGDDTTVAQGKQTHTIQNASNRGGERGNQFNFATVCRIRMNLDILPFGPFRRTCLCTYFINDNTYLYHIILVLRIARCVSSNRA